MWRRPPLQMIPVVVERIQSWQGQTSETSSGGSFESTCTKWIRYWSSSNKETCTSHGQCDLNSLVDLKSNPVKVPAATVLRSSSAPLAFSMTTPNTLYRRAVEMRKQNVTTRHVWTWYKRWWYFHMWDYRDDVQKMSYPQILVCWPKTPLVVWPCLKSWRNTNDVS